MRAIKTIIALATGATMLGATVMGAMAANLADYPKPFVDGCTFSGALVVGEKAAAEDVVGAVDIASSLAVSGTSTATTGTGTSVSVTGEAAKIEKSSNKLNVGEALTAVQTTSLDDGDLPKVLADGVYTNGEGSEYDYEQKVDLNTGLTLSHFADSDYEDKEPTLGIKVLKDAGVFNYSLSFTDNAESDMDATDGLPDLTDTELTILGNKYDIVEADNTTAGVITLELMGGAVKDVMEQGEVKTFTVSGKEYEVEVTYIGGTATSKVKFKVNGEVTDALEESETYKLKDGTQMGVREILEEEAGEVTADQVEFYIGAEKLSLISAAELQVNDEDVDNLNVDIQNVVSGGKQTISKIVLEWLADEDLFVTEKQSVTLPGLESIKLSFEGLTIADEEVVEIENDGEDQITIKMELEGGSVDFPLLTGGDAQNGFYKLGGEDSDELIVANCSTTCVINATTTMFFVASDSNAKETHLIAVDSIDDEDGVTFEDLASGNKYENKKTGSFTIGDVTLNLINYSEAQDNLSIDVTGSASNKIYTKAGLTVNVNNTLNTVGTNSTTQTLVFQEEDEDETLDAGGQFLVVLTHAGTATGNAEVSSINVTTYENQPDTDLYVGYVPSALATKVEWDQGPDQATAKITYHGEEVYGNVYVADIEAGFGKVEGTSGEAVCKVTIPPAKLDSELADVAAQNLILVGGPCANSAAAKVMGVVGTWPECGAGFTEGKAMVKMYDTGAGKTAMLVAGMTAMDTRRATRVVANYGDYALSGDEVEVTGTTLSDISVKAVTPAATE